MRSYSFSVDYDFEEIPVMGAGLMAWGTATLTHDEDGVFYVTDITLTDGTYLNRGGGNGLGTDFNRRIFARISIEIEDDATVQQWFVDKLNERMAEAA